MFAQVFEGGTHSSGDLLTHVAINFHHNIQTQFKKYKHDSGDEVFECFAIFFFPRKKKKGKVVPRSFRRPPQGRMVDAG